MSTRVPFRRRQYIIKRGLQLRFIGIMFSLALLASIVTGYTVFATGWTLLGEKLANVYPQGRLIYVFRATNLTLLRNLLLVSPFIFVLGVLFSHKIAGPLYRIERSIDEIGKGNLTLKIRLRRGDELWDLARIVNTMTENLNRNISLDKEVISKIEEDIGEIKKIISAQPYDRTKLENSINRLEEKLKSLKSSLDNWSTAS